METSKLEIKLSRYNEPEAEIKYNNINIVIDYSTINKIIQCLNVDSDLDRYGDTIKEFENGLLEILNEMMVQENNDDIEKISHYGKYHRDSFNYKRLLNYKGISIK